MVAQGTRGVSIGVSVDARQGVQGFRQIEGGMSSAEQAMKRMSAQARAAGAEIDRAFTGRASLDPFTASVARATNGLGALATKLQSIPAALSRFAGVAGIGAGGLAAGVLAIAKASANAAQEISTLSQRTGVGTESLSRLAYAVKITGGSTSDLENGLQALAGNMQSAAQGGNASAAMFEQLGIAVLRSDGSLRNVDEVFIDLAQRLSELPNGTTKTTAAIALLGNSAEKLIPAINEGRQGLEALANESDRFGQTISESAAAAAREFNQNLERLQSLANGVVMQIGNALIPSINQLAEDFLRAKEAGLSFGQALLNIGLSNPFKTAEEQISSLTDKLAELEKRRQDALGFVGGRAEASAVLPLIDREIALRQSELAYWESKVRAAQDGPDLTEEKNRAQQRLQIEQQLSGEIARLDKLRETAAANATKEEIKGAERLRDALRDAWKTSADAAREARREAAEFFRQADSAASRRNAEANRIEASDVERTGGLRGHSNANSPQSLIQAAERASLFAMNAAIDGRGEAVKRNAEEALRLAEEAAGYVQGLGDDPGAAQLLRQIGEAERQALQAQGKQRLQEAEAQDAAARSIQGQILTAEQRISALKNELGKPVSIQLEITAAEQKIQALKAQLGQLGTGQVGAAGSSAQGSGGAKEIDVEAQTDQAKKELEEVRRAVDAIPDKRQITIETIQANGVPAFSDPVSAFNSSQNTPERYARGGRVLGAGSDTSDSILARLSNGEYVVRAAAVRRYGLTLLDSINGLSLPRFATGGLVSSASVAMSSLTPSDRPAGTPINLHVGDRGPFPMQASQDVAAEVVRVFQTAALQRGRR